MGISYARQKTIDDVISGYIDLVEHSDYQLDDIIQNDPRVEVFWQLSSIKGNIISWYPFKEVDRVLIYGDDFDKLVEAISGTVKECVSYSAKESIEQAENLYDVGIINIHKYPGDALSGFFEIKEMIKQVEKNVSECGVLLILCVHDEINFILDEMKCLGMKCYNIYDPLHIGLLMLEISKDKLVNKLNVMPTELEAEELLLCKWTKTYGIPVFGQRYDIYQDTDIIAKEKNIAIDLLGKLKEVCDKNGLTMFPIYGTLLGAARSGKMIEGDDDIDVALFREDYNKLMRLESAFEEPYFLQTHQNDECFYGGYAKLRNIETTAINPQNWWVNCCEGIGIDIFPVDKGFLDYKKEKRKVKKIKHLQRLLYAKTYGYFASFLDMNLLIWKGYKYIGKLIPKENLFKKLDKVFASGEDSISSPIAIYTHYLGSRIPRYLERRACKETSIVRFEDLTFELPFNWNIFLKNLYGDNYMEPVQWNEDKVRHGFYSVDESYNVYRKRFHGLHRLVSAEGKEIILFGNDVIMRAYLKRYSDEKYKPSKMVRYIDEEYSRLKKLDKYKKKDSIIDNISKTDVLAEIREVDEAYFRDKDLSMFYPIICAIDVRSIENRLKEMGFSDYYVYWENRAWMLRANLSAIRKDICNLESIHF